MRKANFAIGEHYHVYNRGVDNREVFSDIEDYLRFLKSLREFNRPHAIGSLFEQQHSRKMKEPIKNLGVQLPKIVEIVCYCLNPNHFHLIVKQVASSGVEKFMHRVSTGYTNYFNNKYKRSGSLFQGKYKFSHISSDEYLLYVSAYVNCNNEVHGISKAEAYRWSSFSEYLGKGNYSLCDKKIILEQFNNKQEYYNFAKTNLMVIKANKKAQKMALE
ncbi:transposase [Candidatus Omnitrophota bacterium]